MAEHEIVKSPQDLEDDRTEDFVRHQGNLKRDKTSKTTISNQFPDIILPDDADTNQRLDSK